MPQRGRENNETQRLPARISPSSARSSTTPRRVSAAVRLLDRRGTFFLAALVTLGEQFLAEDGYFARGLDAQADFAAVDVYDGYADVVADVDLFSQLAAQHQHDALLL